uniref:Uncharacterized protein n=1 Tax=Cacopsylla melanoneura TaxID=428564 RepID=A0A8D8ZWY2_9HEMI
MIVDHMVTTPRIRPATVSSRRHNKGQRIIIHSTISRIAVVHMIARHRPAMRGKDRTRRKDRMRRTEEVVEIGAETEIVDGRETERWTRRRRGRVRGRGVAIENMTENPPDVIGAVAHTVAHLGLAHAHPVVTMAHVIARIGDTLQIVIEDPLIGTDVTAVHRQDEIEIEETGSRPWETCHDPMHRTNGNQANYKS